MERLLGKLRTKQVNSAKTNAKERWSGRASTLPPEPVIEIPKVDSKARRPRSRRAEKTRLIEQAVAQQRRQYRKKFDERGNPRSLALF
jgi:hypothetical protein